MMNATNRIKLTAMETKVFMAMRQNADNEAGGDFGIMETLKVSGMNRQTLGGYVTALATKGLVHVHEPVYVNGSFRSRGTKVTQFTIEFGRA